MRVGGVSPSAGFGLDECYVVCYGLVNDGFILKMMEIVSGVLRVELGVQQCENLIPSPL
jgi:hypothetical protein